MAGWRMTDPSEPKIVFLFRGVELVPDPRAHYAAWVGPVWITLWRQEAGCTWHHAAATLIDSDTCGRAHVQVKDEDPSKALEKLDRLVGRFAEWGNGVITPHYSTGSP